MPPRLKSLELHGYKTFASRTTFEFPGVITAIVGPNGSGKSNISDSMRWVLGEQSFSALRGRKTEDMIFAGSELRPKAGMASATITFDNADNWLPIDFTEVSITRRAYRDGQNEYLLNGQKVRLREISELLAQSGLAERTYTIIGQGLVDAALALKPEERRRLFEEAAGIGLYRVRREEAINRLENTRRNLERVQDILAELEPRLHSLEKQARRAQEYERIKADLRLLLRDWYGYHWRDKQQELAHARDVLHVHETRLQEARDKEERISTQLQSMRAEIQELRNQLNGWHTQLSRLHQEQEKIGRSLAIFDERQRSLIEQRQNLQNDRVRIEEELTAIQQRITAASAERDRLTAERDESRKQLETAKKTLLERQLERAKVEKELREARQWQANMESRLVQSKAHLAELQTRQGDLRKNIENIEKNLANYNAEAEQSGVRLEKVTKERADAETERKRITDELQEVENILLDRESYRRKKAEERSKLEAQKARLDAQLDVLLQAEQSFSGMGNGPRYLLQARKNGKLSGFFQSFNQLFEVPAEYEIAIAAALGNFLEIILVGKDGDPESALKLLEEGAKGKAALLPIPWLREIDTIKINSEPGIIGIAADLVKFTGEDRRPLDQLLGQVVIVRDRKDARRVLETIPHYARVVTLKGDVFYGNGSVISGSEDKSEASILSRSRQKRELEESKAVNEQDIKKVKDAIRAVEIEISDLHEDENQLKAANKQINQRIEKCNSAFQQALLQAEQAKRQLEWQTNQKNTQENQYQQTRAEIDKSTKEISTNEQKVQEAREKIRQINQTLGGLPTEELQAQVGHWETRAAVGARAVQDAQNRLSDLEHNINRTNGQIQATNNRLVEIDTNLAQLEKDRSVSRNDETRLTGEIDQLQALIKPSEEELAAKDKGYIQIQETDDAAKQNLTVAERYHTQAQLDLTRQREAVESLKRRIEEDFGLVSFEFVGENPGQSTLPFEGMVEQLPVLTQIPPDLEDNINRVRGQLRRMGAINPDALVEYEGVLERFQFLTTQVADLRKADEDLRQVIDELDQLMKREFKKTFDAVAAEFKLMFTRLFGGGSAKLILSDVDHPTETGIDIEARLPGRREQGLSLLSGGERSLTAVALVFSLLKVSPTPFCIMDEVDAMLDEANVGRFRDLLVDLSQTTQFIVITHNRNTVQAADVIYGITMGKDSASQMISLRLDEVSDDMVK